MMSNPHLSEPRHAPVVFPWLLLCCYLVLAVTWLTSADQALTSWFLSESQRQIWHELLGIVLLLVASLVGLYGCYRLTKLHQGYRLLHQHYHSTFDQAPVGMAHVALDGRFIRVNERYAQMLHYDVSEIVGKTFQEFTHPADLADDVNSVQALAAGQIDFYEMEKRYRRRDGSYFWANLSVSYHKEDDPAGCYFVSVIENIEQKKQALLELQASTAQTRLLLESTGDAILGLNRQAEITVVNNAVLHILGYRDVRQLQGLPAQMIVAKQKPALMLWREIIDRMHTGAALSGEADLFVTSEGEVIPVSYRVTPVPEAPDGTVLVVCWQNIRDRRQQQMKQQAQSYLLHRLLEDIPLPELLGELVKFIEQQLPGVRGAIMLADLYANTLHTAAAPSLPEDYQAATEGLPIRYGNGSCGTAAATRQAVFVQDVHQDLLWLNYRDMIKPYEWLQACWSTPFFDTERRLLGTFAIYLAEHRAPRTDEVDLIQFTVSLAAFLVERSQAKARNLLLTNAIEQNPVAVVICDAAGLVQYSNQRFDEITGLSGKDLKDKPLHLTLPETLRDEYSRVMALVLNGTSVPKRPLNWPTHDGSVVWLESAVYSICDAQQQVTHLLLELEDITLQRMAEQQWMESELRFRTLLDNTPEVAVQGYESDGTTFYWNKASETLYGYSKEEALGRNLLDLIIPDAMREGVRLAVQAMARTGVAEPAGELVLQTKAGTPVHVFSSHVVLKLPERSPQIFCMDFDLSERKKQQANQRLADAVFRSSREGILIIDKQKNIVSVNPALLQLFGYAEAELIGQPVSILRSGRHEDEFYQHIWQQLVEDHHWQGELFNRRKDGEVMPLQLSISAVFNEAQEVCHYAAIYTDLSEIRATEAEMMFLTEHDELTHLPNRQLFLQQVDQAIKVARRDHHKFAVLVLDLDHFKDVNDSYGHDIGDLLLLQVANRLKRQLKDHDVLARLGGDEFAILLGHVDQVEHVAEVAAALIDQLGQSYQLQDSVEVQLGASVGISIFPDHGDNTTLLLQGADAALYKAKAAGRNTLTFFSDSYTQAARDRLTLEAQLRKAIRQGHLQVYYQPQLDIYSGRITGAEALVRWFDPEQGMISPARFIPVAEACGLIHDVGEFVLRETCRQGKEWLDAGLPRLTLAVNVSPTQFRRFDMRQLVQDVLAETGYPAQALELELTESALMEHQESVIATLNDLRTTGIRLAIDDFGTGYSSLAYLKRFPLDVLKIDKKFVDDIPQSKDDVAITTAIIGIAHTLGFKVLAEGVESTQQLEFLQLQRCDQYQGYLFSPPVPAARFRSLLELQLAESTVMIDQTN